MKMPKGGKLHRIGHSMTGSCPYCDKVYTGNEKIVKYLVELHLSKIHGVKNGKSTTIESVVRFQNN
jgi:hypothetical protein